MKLASSLMRLAAAAAALSVMGCVGGNMAGLPGFERGPAATAQQAAIPDGNGHGTEHAAHEAADGTQLALAPVPPTVRAKKPETGQAAICGRLESGQNTRGIAVSQGRRFHVECFRADAGAPAPAVIILHGLHGIGRSTIYTRLAEGLNERGIHAFVFQYLTPEPPAATAAANAKPQPQAQTKPAIARTTGQPQLAGKVVTPAKPAPKGPRIGSEAQARAIFDAITAVQALDYVDHGRIGLFGLSLGGFHSLALASRDERIGAVVNMFGAMPRGVAPEVVRMPPVLILHGDRDAIVPVRRAYDLDKLLKKIGTPYEMKIYKGEGHSFRGAADTDSLARSVEFFRKWLGAAPVMAGAG